MIASFQFTTKNTKLGGVSNGGNEISPTVRPNMITAYSWTAGLFQQELPLSLADIEKRAKLVNEINGSLVTGKIHLTDNKMLEDLDNDEKQQCLNVIVQISMPYVTEQFDNKVRKNILFRLWTGCMDAAKAIGFSYVAGVRDGVVIEAQ